LEIFEPPPPIRNKLSRRAADAAKFLKIFQPPPPPTSILNEN
jgi:hypothetical protein